MEVSWSEIAGIAACLSLIAYFFQAHLMREAIIRSNRANVFPANFDVKWIYDNENENRLVAWRFAPIWENIGNTATLNLHLYTSYIYNVEELPKNWNYPDSNIFPIGKSIIGPKQKIIGPYCKVSIQDLFKAKKGNTYIYIYGWAEYQDRFLWTGTHRTEFCNRIIVLDNPVEKSCTFEFQLHNEHNGADQECPSSRLKRWKRLKPKRLYL